MTTVTLTPLDVLARAERRLTPLIERRGTDDPIVLAVTSTYEALYNAAIRGTVNVITDDDAMDVAHAVTDNQGRAL